MHNLVWLDCWLKLRIMQSQWARLGTDSQNNLENSWRLVTGSLSTIRGAKAEPRVQEGVENASERKI